MNLLTRLTRLTGLLAGVSVLAACSSTGAPLPGPMLESPVIQGEIQDGVYRARGDWFHIAMPLHPGSEEYRSLQVHEEYPPYVAFVSFSPLTYPGEYYRVYAEDFMAHGHPTDDLSVVADSAVQLFGRQLGDQRLAPMQLIDEENWQTPHTHGLLRFYEEAAPLNSLTGNIIANSGLGEDYTAYILVYTTQHDGKITMVWAEWPHGCGFCTPPPAAAIAGDDPLANILGQNSRAADFINSLEFGNN